MSHYTPGCKCPPVHTPCPARSPPSAALAGVCQSGGTVGRPCAGQVPPRGSTGQATGTGQPAAEVAPSGPVEVAEVDGHKQEDKEPIEPHKGQGQRVPAGWGTSGGGSHDPPVAQWYWGGLPRAHCGLPRTSQPLPQQPREAPGDVPGAPRAPRPQHTPGCSPTHRSRPGLARLERFTPVKASRARREQQDLSASTLGWQQ